MKILFIGEIVARPGREAVSKVLSGVLGDNDIDLVAANIDNLAHGRGATLGTVEEMQKLGIDIFTGGDHLFWHDGFDKEVASLPVVRPANLSKHMSGDGYKIVETKSKKKVLVTSLMGQTYMGDVLDNPFTTVDEILELKGLEADAIIVDFHGEATSDKYAFGFYVDGRVDAVVGTHTHVPTSDCRVLPEGTMCVSDVGMCGNIDSVLGVKKEIIIDRMVYTKKRRFEWELEGRQVFRSVLIDTVAKEMTRIDKDVE